MMGRQARIRRERRHQLPKLGVFAWLWLFLKVFTEQPIEGDCATDRKAEKMRRRWATDLAMASVTTNLTNWRR